MAKTRSALTAEQLTALRAAPASGTGNRIRVAMALANLRYIDLVAGMPTVGRSHLSRIVNGHVPNVELRTAQTFADFFGCTVDDLFPMIERSASAGEVA